VRADPGPWLIAIALVGSVAVPVWLGGLPALRVVADVPPSALVMVLVPTLVAWFARAAKLCLLTRRLGLRLPASRVIGISLATDFAFVTTPGGIGGYAANILLLRRAGATTSQATSITAADQIVDAAFFALALPTAAVFAIGTAASPVLLRIAFTGSGVLLVGAIVALTLRRRLAQVLMRTTSALAARFAFVARMSDVLARSARETGQLFHGDRRYAIALAGFTTVQWVARYGILWVVLAVLGHEVPYPIVLLAQALVMHAAQWSGMPAGAGAAELGLAATLSPWMTASAFAPAAILWRLASLHLTMLAGGISLLRLMRQPRKAPDGPSIDGQPASSA